MSSGTSALAKGGTSPARNLETCRRFVEIGLNQKNLASIAEEILAPDLVLEAPGVPMSAGRAQGNAIFHQAVGGFVAAFPDVKCWIPYHAADGDAVAIDIAYEGTHRAEFMGVPATGKHIRAGELWSIEFDDSGKMKNVRICEYGTPLRALLQG